MVGNRSTTDVKICGEDNLIFSSEDCNTIGCDGEWFVTMALLGA